MYECTLFDNCNEMIFTHRGDCPHAAVTGAYRRMMVAHVGADTAAAVDIDELRCTGPSDEGLQRGKPVVQSSGDFFVVYDGVGCSAPLGFVRRIP